MLSIILIKFYVADYQLYNFKSINNIFTFISTIINKRLLVYPIRQYTKPTSYVTDFS